MIRAVTRAIGVVAFTWGCGDDDRAPIDSGVPRDTGGGPVADSAAPADTGSMEMLPPATVNDDGVLSAFPHLDYVMMTPGYTLVTANFLVDDRGFLDFYGEVRNDGIEPGCPSLPEVFLDFREILSSIEADPHYSDIITTVTSDCIPPGGIGVIDGLGEGFSEETLASASTLTIDVDPNDFGVYTPATDGPTLSGVMIMNTAEGWLVSGEVTPRIMIRNLGMRGYARDSRGVIFHELFAFPGELERLPAGVPVPFATEHAPREFDEYQMYVSWIRD